MEATIASVIASLATSHPVVLTILTLIGVLRVTIKPLMSLLHAEAAQLGSAKMEAGLDSVEQSKVYTTLVYVLDWFASVKVQAVAPVPAAIASAPAVAPVAAPATDSKPAA